MKYEKIYLVGFMGCGKSTLGRKLAKSMGWDFVDLDDYIEEKEQQSISDMFSENGEAYFRNLETLTLKETKDWTKTVISCGGGTPCFNNNIDLINDQGFSIFINLTPEVLVDRLQGEKDKRPLIAKLSDSELLSFIQDKLSERLKFYNSSKMIFDYSDEKEAEFLKELSGL